MAIHYACGRGHSQCVQLILHHGGRINSVNKVNVMIDQILKNRFDISRVLCMHGLVVYNTKYENWFYAYTGLFFKLYL